jgi:hypothetical protein
MTKYTPEEIAEAARFDWEINPITGEWSSECIICDKHKVLPSTMICDNCLTAVRRKNWIANLKESLSIVRLHKGDRHD